MEDSLDSLKNQDILRKSVDKSHIKIEEYWVVRTLHVSQNRDFKTYIKPYGTFLMIWDKFER